MTATPHVSFAEGADAASSSRLRDSKARRRAVLLRTVPIGLSSMVWMFRVLVSGASAALLLASLGLSAVVCVGTIALVRVILQRRMRKVLAMAWPATSAVGCVEASNLQAFCALVVEEAHVRLLNRKGVVTGTWPYSDLREANVEKIPVGLRKASGLVLHLNDGHTVELLMPSPSFFAYSTTKATQVAQDLRRRMNAPHLTN